VPIPRAVRRFSTDFFLAILRKKSTVGML
jgi:hypothetical protein